MPSGWHDDQAAFPRRNQNQLNIYGPSAAQWLCRRKAQSPEQPQVEVQAKAEFAQVEAYPCGASKRPSCKPPYGHWWHMVNAGKAKPVIPVGPRAFAELACLSVGKNVS